MATILIIDDDDDVRDTLAAVIEEAGHAAVVAPDAATGVLIFTALHPDLVLVDIIMPEMDGLEAIAKIRSIDAGARIAAMSGGSVRLASSYCVDTARKFGATAILQKPFEPAELIGMIERCLHDRPLVKSPS